MCAHTGGVAGAQPPANRFESFGFGKYIRRLPNSATFFTEAPVAEGDDKSAPDTEKWQPLFNGQSLAGWKVNNFGGDGEVTVDEGKILLGVGVTLTGIRYDKEVPKTNYEIRLEAMRTEGIDFFCGLTFPVADSHCSFIAAGWAGSVVGLSCIDGADASENETTKYMPFKNDRWYKIRVRVTPEKITAWIDDEQVVDQSIVGRRISLRAEVEDSRPLGIAAWQSAAALRNIELRSLEESPAKQ